MSEQISSKRYSEANNFCFSILIPSWNNLEFLKLCIGALRKNSTFSHQLIVHVNDGSDGSLEWIRAQQIDHTHSTQNVGVCYALNAAAGLALASYIVYMNDDMYACPDWDGHLMHEIKSTGHDMFFLSGTMIEPESGNKAACAAHDFGRSPENFREADLLKEFAALPHSDWSGATWPPNVLPKKLWDLVGGYSTEFSPGLYSDPDFSMKLWMAGVRLFKGVSKSRVYHFRSRSTARVVPNNGRKQFAAKWGLPASYLYKKVLRMGEPFTGPLPEMQPDMLARLKAWWQRVK